MAEKGSAPPPQQEQQQSMAAAPPPSYEASLGHQVAGASGGFAMPPGSMPQQDFPKQANYIPPQQGAAPSGQPRQPVIVQYVNAPNFGPHPVNMTCPHCQAQVRTSTDSEPGPMAWILAGVLCVVGLWPCACIPCCIESLNSVTHKCPQCKNFLGRYKGGL